MRRFMVMAAVALMAATGFAPTASAGTSGTAGTASRVAAPYCGITWGSLPKVDDHYSGRPITNLRAGRHECYDRLVVDLGSGPGQVGYDVRYVDRVVADGSGATIPLAGGAFISATVRAPAHDAQGRPTYAPANPSRAVDVSGFSTFRQVAFAGTFEGQTLVGLGVRARLPFRVFVLAGPGTGARLVIDVAHHW
jgi:hypothetical protein